MLTDKMRGHLAQWKARHQTAWQLILYLLLGCITTAVEMAFFTVFHFWVFVPFRDQPFSWWIIDYSVENGGMTAFLTFANSYAIAQVFNFFLQRKTTFKANNNIAKSAIMYAVMVIFIYFFQLYLPTLIRAPLVGVLGVTFGDLLAKTINMSSSTLIEFPLNKWVIMRRREG